MSDGGSVHCKACGFFKNFILLAYCLFMFSVFVSAPSTQNDSYPHSGRYTNLCAPKSLDIYYPLTIVRQQMQWWILWMCRILLSFVTYGGCMQLSTCYGWAWLMAVANLLFIIHATGIKPCAATNDNATQESLRTALLSVNLSAASSRYLVNWNTARLHKENTVVHECIIIKSVNNRLVVLLGWLTFDEWLK